ncbi:MAG TPA: efflux RND transporter periplasmic adaptor subunit [Candidatus Acidoferrales bacterium]|nr:efflux RND transporter periplasmic adaptor subunit [Candidatus Acidoferrales bacterium]
MIARGLLAFAIAAAGLAAAGCSKEAAPPEPVVAVQVATVQKGTMQEIVTADAVLYPLEQATLVPKISAPVRKFYVNRGSKVRAGELLATLDNKDLSAALVENKGAYDQAQAQYDASTKVNLPAQIQAATLDAQNTQHAMEAAESVYKSRQQLYKSGAIARNLLDQSQVAYVQARSQYEIAQANLKSLQAVGKDQQLKSAEGQLKSAEGRYQAAQAQYGYSEIRSPISGVVTDRPLYEGEMASAGTPLITVMNTSHVVARAHLSPQEAAGLRVGDAARISLGNGKEMVKGKVSVVSPALDPNSTTVQVWIEAANPEGQLKPGATVQIRAIAKTIPNALQIPASAILTDSDGKTSVMVVGQDDHAHQTPVSEGIQQDGKAQIVSGLKEGQRVVTEGAYGLPDGTKVKF